MSQATELDIAFPNRIVTGTVFFPDGELERGALVPLSCRDVDIDGFVGSVCMGNQTTDANGRFQLALAAPGDLAMRVFGAPPGSFDFTITDDSDIVVQFQPPLATSGQVLAADGSPIAGIGVCYNPTLPFSGSQRCATTDASGQYQLSLMPDTYLVSLFGIVTGAGISFISFTDTIPVPSPPATIQLAATRSTPVKIVNTDGSPLAGASLAAECFTAPAGDATENICGQTLVSDAAGTATVIDGVGVPLDSGDQHGSGAGTAAGSRRPARARRQDRADRCCPVVPVTLIDRPDNVFPFSIYRDFTARTWSARVCPP